MVCDLPTCCKRCPGSYYDLPGHLLQRVRKKKCVLNRNLEHKNCRVGAGNIEKTEFCMKTRTFYKISLLSVKYRRNRH